MEGPEPRGVRVASAAGVVFVGAAIYATFVYATWHRVGELEAMFPPFAVLSVCLGFAVAGFPFVRPLRTAFVCGVATPPLAFLMRGALAAVAPPAAAGGPGTIADDGQLLLLIGGFVLGIALLFGSLSSAGCFLGLRFGRLARRALAPASGAPAAGVADGGVDPATALTARVTVAVALIGAAANIAIALI